MRHWLDGDLHDLVLPRHLDALREMARAGMADPGLEALYAALAKEQPLALMELTMGPKALEGSPAVAAALSVVEAIEASSSPAAVTRRLMELGEPEAVLASACARHPSAIWLVGLAERAEAQPGSLQLREARSHPAYAQICHAHARARHLDALMAEGESGRAEAAGALLAAGHDRAALAAAHAALAAEPTADVVAHLAAAAGPELDEWLYRLVPGLRTRAAAEALLPRLAPFPQAQRRLSVVLPGMRG